MSHSPSPTQDMSPPRCADCHRPLIPGPDPAGPVAYGTVRHDDRYVHLCHACHAPAARGVYVVIPATADDRWVSLHHPH